MTYFFIKYLNTTVLSIEILPSSKGLTSVGKRAYLTEDAEIRKSPGLITKIKILSNS